MRKIILYAACLMLSVTMPSLALKLAIAGELEEFDKLHEQFNLLVQAGRYPEAETLARKSLAIAEYSFAKRPLIIAGCLTDLVTVLAPQGKYQEGIDLQKRALVIIEKERGGNHIHLADGLLNLSNCYANLARYDEAESSCKRALAIREKELGDLHPDVSHALTYLGNLYYIIGRLDETESVFKRALAINEKAFGDQHEQVAVCLGNLARQLHEQGRYIEAEQLGNRALKIYEKSNGPNHPYVAFTLVTLGEIHASLGHNSQAETLLQRALTIRKKNFGDQHISVASVLASLSRLLCAEHRWDDAEPLIRNALTINEKNFGDRHPRVAESRTQLAKVCARQSRYADAKALYNSALEIKEKVFGDQHQELISTLTGLASVFDSMDRTSDAESVYQRALHISVKSLGEQHPTVAACLYDLAFFYHNRARDSEAEELIDRAISIEDRAGIAAQIRFYSYLLRSRISWKLGRKNEAVLDLRQALDLAEQARQQVSGADVERAQSFSRFDDAFEQMVAWQSELGDAAEALQAIERSRARSLLDEMNRVGTDLNLGRSSSERKALQEKESQLKLQVAQFEKQRELAPEAEKEKLNLALIQARKALYEQYRDERSSSPVYRNLLSTGSGPPRISQLQRTLVAHDGLALAYLFGENAGYVVVLNSQQARTVALVVDEGDAKLLRTTAGPLTNVRLQEILIGQNDSGIVPQLATPPTNAKPQNQKRLTAQLAALWQLLIPESERDALTGNKYKRLIVVPDGPLALFPFESLVVQGEQDPVYLLDCGPAILYTPSLTVLYNLSTRSKVPQGTIKPVLTVADPVYALESQLATTQDTGLSELASRTRYAGVGGQLNRLPFTAEESNVVRDVFTRVGLVASSLMREQATEGSVRQNVSGRKIVHLACHGVTDQAHGNFFGALALTPGKQSQADSTDDGYLTLPEIYELDMKGCELAILSACQTNYGPQQQGEGVWALSRGFLVGGARRVVASNWLVNDEAGARLIQYYCTALANDEKQSQPADYARQLQAAKKWVRTQPNWKHPYFWSTFVLVGPQ